MTIPAKRLLFLACAAITAGLSGCGGGDGGIAAIGGTVSGLANGRTLTLQNNLGDDFTITGNGANSFTFTFANGVAAGGNYSATVRTQPLGQTCTVTGASGVVDSNADPVSSIVVSCSTTSSVIGTVAGLVPGVAVTLTSNGASLVLGTGSFSFPGVLAAGATYAVTVSQQPLNQICAIANATGTVVANASASVTVTCQ